MSKLTYVFAWMTGDNWNCKTAENGEWYREGDFVELKLGSKEQWFRVAGRNRIGDVVALHLCATEHRQSILDPMMAAVAEFRLHLESVNE